MKTSLILFCALTNTFLIDHVADAAPKTAPTKPAVKPTPAKPAAKLTPTKPAANSAQKPTIDKSAAERIAAVMDTVAGSQLMPYNLKGKWGFAKRSGNAAEVAIAPTYELAYPFREGRAAVKQGGKWGFINAEGKTIIPFQFDDLQTYQFARGGVCVVKKGYTRGVIDRNGKEILPVNFLNVFVDENAGTIVATLPNLADPNSFNDLHGLYDFKGKVLLPHEYSRIYNWFKNGVSVATKGDRKALINNKGQFLTGFDYENVFHSDIDSFNAQLPNEGAYHIYDPHGKLLFKASPSHGYVSNVREGLAQFKDKATKRWGYLNAKGEVALPAQWVLTKDFSEGVAFVQQEILGPLEVINTRGQTVGQIPGADGPHLSQEFKNGLAWARNEKDFKYYCYNTKLERVFPQGYKYVRNFDENGLCEVTVEDKKIGLIDRTGKLVVPAEYSRIERSKAKGQYIVTDGKHSSIVDNTGAVVFAKQPVEITSFDESHYKIAAWDHMNGDYYCFWNKDNIYFYVPA